MNINVKKIGDNIVFTLDKPHKLKELNVNQLKKLHKRAKRFGLSGEVEAELNRRLERGKNAKASN